MPKCGVLAGGEAVGEYFKQKELFVRKWEIVRNVPS